MKRNGIGQLQVNGKEAFTTPAKRGTRNGSRGGSHVAQKIEQSISYMLQHLDQPLHVANLAAAVNISASHFSALFKNWMGCPPIDYFIHLRMRHGCWLLDNTSLRVKEVAARLGYDDPFYFSRMFKLVNRIAPSEYRAMAEKLKDGVRQAALPLVSAIHKNAGIDQGIFGRPTQIEWHEAPKQGGCAVSATRSRNGEKNNEA